MSHAKVTAVVVTYQSERSIGRALTSLARSQARGLLECIVVDNVSRDRTLELVRRDHPWVRVIETGANIGYGRGLNAGLAVASTPYIMFMNPDAAIEPAGIERMLAFLEARPNAALVAPAIVEGDHLQDAGVLTTPRTILARALGVPLASMKPRTIVQGEPPFQTDWLCGALLVGRTGLLREVGGFDPRIFLYFEETDLCRRMLDRGLELWALGEAVATHEGGASAAQAREGLYGGCIAEHFFRSRYYYLVKHWGGAAAALTEAGEILLLQARWFLRWLRGRDATDIVAGLRRPIMRLPVMPRERS